MLLIFPHRFNYWERGHGPAVGVNKRRHVGGTWQERGNVNTAYSIAPLDISGGGTIVFKSKGSTS
jgi:hypothetical protein